MVNFHTLFAHSLPPDFHLFYKYWNAKRSLAFHIFPPLIIVKFQSLEIYVFSRFLGKKRKPEKTLFGKNGL